MKSSKKYKVPFSCGVEYNGDLYLASVVGNDLFKYDLRINELTYVLSFDKEKDSGYLYRCAKIYKNQAWFIPQCADNIAIVNLDTKKVDYIQLKFNWKENRINFKYTTAGIFNKKFLYLVPYDIDTLLVIDMDFGEIREYCNIVNSEQKYGDAFYLNGYLYLIPWTASTALRLDLENGQAQPVQWEWKKKDYVRVILDEVNSEVWFVPAAASQITVYNWKRQRWNMIQCEGEIENYDVDYINSIYGEIVNDEIIIFPYNSNYIIIIEKKTRHIKRIKVKDDNRKIFFMKVIDGYHLFAIAEMSNLLFEYDEKRNDFKRRNVYLTETEKFLNCCSKKIIEKNNQNIIIEEKYGKELSKYLECIKN